MRAVITVPWGERLGGAEEMLWALLRRVNRIEPTVVFLQGGDFEREVAALGLRTAVVPGTRLRRAGETTRAVRTLAAILERERPELILNWMPKTQLYGATAASLARMADRVVWWQHNVPKGHWMDRLATRFPARAVGCSSHASARAQERLRPRRETFVVHPGIDPGFADVPEPALDLRRELEIPPGRKVAGIVGRLQPWKRQHHFIRAIAELRGRGVDAHGLVVGGEAYGLSAGYEAELRALTEGIGVVDAITFTGQVADVAPFVRLMDVLVNASENEPFGIVLLEGMALGVPVVAVARGGPVEIVESGRSGVLIESSAPAAIADALGRILSDDRRRVEMGDAALRTVLERFTTDRMAAALERELEALAP